MSQTTSIIVNGMTCGHCTNAVTSELKEIDGVQDVQIDLVAGGDSPVTITSEGPVDPAEIKAAVDEAGYTVVM